MSYDALIEELRHLREDRGICGLSDETLSAIASRCPSTIDSLRRVSGVGPAILERHGIGIIAVTARHKAARLALEAKVSRLQLGAPQKARAIR